MRVDPAAAVCRLLESNIELMSSTIAELKRKLHSISPPAAAAAAPTSTVTVTVASLPFVEPSTPLSAPFDTHAPAPHAGASTSSLERLEGDGDEEFQSRLLFEPEGPAAAVVAGDGVVASAPPPAPLGHGPCPSGNAGPLLPTSAVEDVETSTVPKATKCATEVGLAISISPIQHLQPSEPLSAVSSPGDTAHMRLDDVLALERSVSVLTSHPALVSPPSPSHLLQPSGPVPIGGPTPPATDTATDSAITASGASTASTHADSEAMQSAVTDVDQESTRSGSRSRSRRRSNDSEELDVYLDAFEPESDSPTVATAASAMGDGELGRDRAASLTERSSVCSCNHDVGTACSCTSAPSRCSTSPCSVSPVDELLPGGAAGAHQAARPRKGSKGGTGGGNKRRRVSITQASSSIKTPLSPFIVVWAKMVGYPWYPAIVCCSSLDCVLTGLIITHKSYEGTCRRDAVYHH